MKAQITQKKVHLTCGYDPEKGIVEHENYPEKGTFNPEKGTLHTAKLLESLTDSDPKKALKLYK